eukprot:5860084-Amphidinium_carterae.1
MLSAYLGLSAVLLCTFAAWYEPEPVRRKAPKPDMGLPPGYDDAAWEQKQVRQWREEAKLGSPPA